MTRRIRRWAIVLSGALTLFGLGPAAGAATGPRWVPQTQLGYSGESVTLEAISATSGGDVWATGYVYTGIEFRTVALHRHAGVWGRVPTPDVETAPAQDFLNGVAAVSPSNVWMVGSSATSSSSELQRPLVEHWDGTDVSIVAVPDPSDGHGAALTAVSGSKRDLWVVGGGENADFESVGEVEHYNGNTWRVVSFHAVAPGCNDRRGASLTSVLNLGSGNVYVGGWCNTAHHQIGFVEEYRSGTWTLSATTPAIGQINSLAEAADSSVWAAGTQQSSGGGAGWLRGVALHGSGSSFTSVNQAIPNAGIDEGFAGISVSGPDVIAVGIGPSAQPPFVGFGAYTLSGRTWVADAVWGPFDGFGRFFAVTRDSSGDLLAAGFGIGSSGDVGLVSIEKI